MRVAAEAAIELRQLLMHHGMARDRIVECLELRLGRQLAIQQQVAAFEEGGMLSQVADIVAAILQHALVAIDEGDVGFGRGGGGEAGIVGEDVGLVEELADVHSLGALCSGIDWKIVALAIKGKAGCSGSFDFALSHFPTP